MPTYEYECKKCGKKFDIFQNITEDPIKSCPKCKGKVNRLIGSGSGIIFKGSGFYHTDYKKPKCSANKNNSACKSCPKKRES